MIHAIEIGNSEEEGRETMKKFKQTKGGSQPGLVAKVPAACQLCGGSFGQTAIDGKTRQGRWGWMCRGCHSAYGCGLGIGKGQEYRLS